MTQQTTAPSSATPDGADAQAAERAALVAGLRELADFFEWHSEVLVPGYPSFSMSVGQSGEWTKDTTLGTARVETVAAALGVDVQRDTHIAVERKFAGLTFRAYFIPEEAQVDRSTVDDQQSKIWACPTGCGYHIADGPPRYDGDEPTDELIRQHMVDHEPASVAIADAIVQAEAASPLNDRPTVDDRTDGRSPGRQPDSSSTGTSLAANDRTIRIAPGYPIDYFDHGGHPRTGVVDRAGRTPGMWWVIPDDGLRIETLIALRPGGAGPRAPRWLWKAYGERLTDRQATP